MSTIKILLIVFGIFILLVGATILVPAFFAAKNIIRTNPSKVFAEARNSQRSSNVLSIIFAVRTYATDHGGALPTSISGTQTEICATNAASCTGLVDLSVLTANQTYMANMPKDPDCDNPNSCGNGTGYAILTMNNIVHVKSMRAELNQIIEATPRP